MSKKAIFLDRDGTLNVDKGYVYKLEDLQVIDGVCEGLKSCVDKGYILIVITNQSGIGRGYYTIEDMNNFNKQLKRSLAEKGVTIDKIYYCPHSPEDNCNCRKPKVELVDRAVKDFDIDLSRSFFIGDRDSDILCGKNVGCKTIFIDGNHKNNVKADFTINNMREIRQIV